MVPIEQAYMPIIAAAAAEVAVVIAWYSDHLFGPMWKKLGGKSSGNKDFYQKLSIHALAALVTATALYIAISVFQQAQTDSYTTHGLGQIFAMFLHKTDQAMNNTLLCSMKIAGFLWLGFLAPSKVICAAWASENWKKTAIEVGGQFASLVVMAAVIASMS